MIDDGYLWEVLEQWPCNNCHAIFRQHSISDNPDKPDEPMCPDASGFAYDRHPDWDPETLQFKDDM